MYLNPLLVLWLVADVTDLVVLFHDDRNAFPIDLQVWINTSDIILIGLRDYQDTKADVILKYTADEARNLKVYGELPESGMLMMIICYCLFTVCVHFGRTQAFLLRRKHHASFYISFQPKLMRLTLMKMRNAMSASKMLKLMMMILMRSVNMHCVQSQNCFLIEL